MERTTLRGLQSTEFTYQWYGDFLDGLRERGYRFGTFDESPAAGEVLLRHDVDLSVEAALRLARLEADRGVRSTYFVLLGSPLYNVLERGTRDRVREIRALGHDVGLHFNTHAYWPRAELPREDDLTARVRAEQAILGGAVTDLVEAVSFHIPPTWLLARSFDGLTSTYEPRFFSDVGYLADSGQRWRDAPPTPPDYPAAVQVLTHPGLWYDEDTGFAECVERAIDASCRYGRDGATREFIGREFSR